VVDRVDIGLLKVTEAVVRRSLNQTISELSDAIQQGLTGIAGNFRFGVTSLRQCASGHGINNGCSIGTLVATGPPSEVLFNATMSVSVTRACPPVPTDSSAGNAAASNSITYWLLTVIAFLCFYE